MPGYSWHVWCVVIVWPIIVYWPGDYSYYILWCWTIPQLWQWRAVYYSVNINDTTPLYSWLGIIAFFPIEPQFPPVLFCYYYLLTYSFPDCVLLLEWASPIPQWRLLTLQHVMTDVIQPYLLIDQLYWDRRLDKTIILPWLLCIDGGYTSPLQLLIDVCGRTDGIPILFLIIIKLMRCVDENTGSQTQAGDNPMASIILLLMTQLEGIEAFKRSNDRTLVWTSLCHVWKALLYCGMSSMTFETRILANVWCGGVVWMTEKLLMYLFRRNNA